MVRQKQVAIMQNNKTSSVIANEALLNALFPESFRFQLTKDEFENWKSQIATSNSEKMGLRRASMQKQQQTPNNAESFNPSKGLLYNHVQQHPSSLVTGSPEAGSNRGVSFFQGRENR